MQPCVRCERPMLVMEGERHTTCDACRRRHRTLRERLIRNAEVDAVVLAALPGRYEEVRDRVADTSIRLAVASALKRLVRDRQVALTRHGYERCRTH